MFGKNPIRSVDFNASMLAIEEMFFTLQGEGPQSGRPALFIRAAGCNLACHFCDTQFETQAEILHPLSHICSEVLKFKPEQRKLVVLTGGEPLRQNFSGLVQFLINNGTELVQIETAGTLWQPDLLPFIEAGRVQIVCSPKTPKIRKEITEHCRHWKYIIKEEPIAAWDGLPGVGTQVNNQHSFQQIYRCPGRIDDVIWVSPCDEYNDVKNQANLNLATQLCLTHGYRLSLQVHKIVKLP